ncbi:TPA: hypothetical protein ACH3X2_005557 [Trebouxia sp. C0005]
MRITVGVPDTLIKPIGGLLRSRGARLARVTKIRMSATYSIWIEPKGPLAARLQKEINYLADPYGGPTFPPHVTLVGGVNGPEEQIIECAKGLADTLQPYRIEFEHPAYGGIYHQCVYMLCHQDDATMAAGQLSKQTFGQGQMSSYMPHLSLLYSDIDEHVRKQAVTVVKKRLDEHSVDKLPDTGFDVDSIHVYTTDPDDKLCKTWKRIKELPITK